MRKKRRCPLPRPSGSSPSTEGSALFQLLWSFPPGEDEGCRKLSLKRNPTISNSGIYQAGQIANSTDPQSEQLSLGISPAQNMEKGHCGYSSSYSPLSLRALRACPENVRPVQHFGGIQPLAAATLQSISQHMRCKDEVLPPHLLRVHPSSTQRLHRA